MDTVSVIVPVYNVEPYLDRCVESLLDQTYPALEILLIDDGSTDRSPALCDAWAVKDARIRVLHQANGGVSAARNRGLEMAGGKYVHFADADDWVEKDGYREIMEQAQASEPDLLVFSASEVTAEGTRVLFDLPEDAAPADRRAAKIRFLRGELCWTNCWSKLYRLDLIRAHGIRFREDLRMGEDYRFTYDYLDHADRFAFLNRPLYYYDRTRESSASNTRNEAYFTRWKVTEELRQEEQDPPVQNALLERLVSELYTSLRASLHLPEKRALFEEALAAFRKYLPLYRQLDLPCPKGMTVLAAAPWLYKLLIR